MQVKIYLFSGKVKELRRLLRKNTLALRLIEVSNAIK